MIEKIKLLLECPEWNQEKLALKLNVKLDTVKSWTRSNQKTRRNPNKWVMPKLQQLLDKAGIR